MIPTEAEEGKALVAYLRIKGYRFTHIANETGSGRGARFQGIRNKQQGTAKGFPDYIIWVDGQMLAVELKRLKGSNTSPEQKEWIDFFNSIGTPARICKGWVSAKDFIEEVGNERRSKQAK